MRRVSYNRWNRVNNRYYNTIWRSSDLYRWKKRSKFTHSKVVKNIRAYYQREYRRHLRVLRVLSINCWKRIRKLVKIWRSKKRAPKRPRRPITRPRRPTKRVYRRYFVVIRGRRVRHTRRWLVRHGYRYIRSGRRYRWVRRSSWKYTTSSRWMTSHIRLPTITRTVFSKELSSVQNYAQTINAAKTQFAKSDLALINKCAKFFQ